MSKRKASSAAAVPTAGSLLSYFSKEPAPSLASAHKTAKRSNSENMKRAAKPPNTQSVDGTTPETALCVEDSSDDEGISCSRRASDGFKHLLPTPHYSIPAKRPRTRLSATPGPAQGKDIVHMKTEEWWMDDDEVMHFNDDDVLEDGRRQVVEISDDEYDDENHSCPVCGINIMTDEDGEVCFPSGLCDQVHHSKSFTGPSTTY